MMAQERAGWKRGLLLLIFPALLLVLALMGLGNVAEGERTWVVDDDGKGDFETIQDAVNASEDGDTIRVWEGVYYENVVVEKSVSLVGNGSDVTTINGSGGSNVVYIQTDRVSFSGFKVTNGGVGIRVIAEDCEIYESNFSENSDGVYIPSSKGCTVRDNSFFSNQLHGIEIYRTQECTFSGNTMVGNGIYLRSGDLEDLNTHDIDTTNTVNGKPLYYYKNQTGKTVPAGAGQVILVNCEYMTVRDQNLSGGTVGLTVLNSPYSTISNNNCSSNTHRGIYLEDGEHSTLTNNTCSGNGYSGIHDAAGISLRKAPNSRVENNTCVGNDGDGIEIYSDHSLVKNNTCSDNEAGIRMAGAEHVTLRDNRMTGDGLYIGGSSLQNWNTHDIDTTNTVNEKPVYFYKDRSDITVPTGAGQVFLISCERMEVTDQNCSDVMVGVMVRDSSDVIIRKGTFSNNVYGIRLEESDHNTIENNTCNHADDYGIYVASSSSWNNLTNNTCSWSKGEGIWIRSSGNLLENNTSNSNLYDGIYLSGPDNTLINNTCSLNGRNGIDIGHYDDNVIANNSCLSNGAAGIQILYSNDNQLLNNTLSGNKIGIYIKSLPGDNARSENNEAHHNKISNNTEYGIDASDNFGFIINATHNWWGDSSGPHHPTNNSEGKGDNVTNDVIFDPWIRETSIHNTNRGSYHKTIQEAIDDADEGDTILVSEGVYYENIIINKTLTLIGSGSANTTIDGGGEEDAVRITADWCNVSGFLVTGDGGHEGNGLRIESDYNTVFNNTYLNNIHGIELSSAFNNSIINNTCTSNEGAGIDLKKSNHNTLVNNTCSHNWHGIRLWNSDSNILRKNQMTNNSVYIDGDSVKNWNTHDIDTTNTVNKKPVYYYNNTQDLRIPDGAGEVILANCSDITVENQIINDGSTGILMGFSTNITIANNTCLRDNQGIALKYTSNSRLVNNTCSFNENSGIYLGGSSYNTLSHNKCTENDRWGIFLYVDSQHNYLFNNTCSRNKYGIYIYISHNHTLHRNTITDNDIGIWLRGSSDDNRAYYNTIVNNTDYGIDASRSINATDNWWGDDSGPYHPVENPEGKGDNVTDDVIFDPWLKRLVHNINKDIFYWTIQEAIDDADPDDTIKVSEGVYYENIIINKTLTLIGSGSANTTIDGGEEGNVVEITADWCNVSGFKMLGSGRGFRHAGITVWSNYNRFAGNNCSENSWGIYLNAFDNNAIINNTCSFNRYHGINLDYSSNCTITNNTCSKNNDHGIRLWAADNNTLANNTCFDNGGYGIYLLSSSTGNVISRNICSDNEEGICVQGSGSTTLSNNTCFDNDRGIYLEVSENIILSNNTLVNNSVYLLGSRSVTLLGNVMNNGGVTIGGEEAGEWDSHVIDSSNTVNGKPIYYYVSSHNVTVPEDAGQIILVDCGNMTLENQDLGNCSVGIRLAYCANITLANNSCRWSDSGIRIRSSEQLTITNCTLSNNKYEGIHLEKSTDIILANNSCQDNGGPGISLTTCVNAILVNNSCLGNRHGLSLYYYSDRNTITHNNCSNNRDAGIFVDLSRENRIISNTIASNQWGIALDGSDLNMIRDNTVITNEIGVCVWYSSSGNTAHNNTISGNEQYGIEASSDSPINATDNWWGDDSGPYHPTGNPAGKGDNITDYVEFDPWTDRSKPVHNTDKDTYHNTIQGAIDEADEGDEIRVFEGVYYENVVINKTLTFIGNGSANTTIDGGGEGDVVRITADWCNVSGFKMTGSGDGPGNAGIKVEADHNHIVDNMVSNNQGDGICLDGSNDNVLRNNTCKSNGNRGIYLDSPSENNILFENTISGNNNQGIHLRSSHHNTILNNTCYLNHFGIHLDRTDNSIITSNRCFSNTGDGIRLDGNGNTVANNTCTSNIGAGIYLWTANNNTIKSNICDSNSAAGIEIRGDDNTVANNTCISNSGNGIRIYGDDNTVANNTCSSNWGYGINFDSAHGSTVANNTCSDNDKGIDLERSRNTAFYHNRVENGSFLITGTSLEYWNTHSIDSTNTVNGKSVRYYKNTRGITIPPGAGQIILANCSRIVIEDQHLSNGCVGILIGYSSNNTIANSTCSANILYGINLQWSDNNSIENSTCSSNEIGVFLKGSSNNTLTNNIISGNDVGVYLAWSSQGNTAHHNNIYGNTVYSINASYNSGYTINATGNWWGDDSGPYHETGNPVGKGDIVTDYVDFDPWLDRSSAPEATIYVWAQAPMGGDGSWERPYNAIQEAIDAAEEGATIYVWEGTYLERVVVNRNVSLVGNGSGSTVIFFDGNDDVVRIEADWVSMGGFTLMGDGGSYASLTVLDADHTRIFENRCTGSRYGINLLSVDNNTIERNNCSGNTYGIYLFNLKSSIVVGNNCSSNGGYGLYAAFYENSELSFNTCSSNGWYGIYLSTSSSYNTLRNNSCASNTYSGIFLSSNINNTIMDNRCFMNGDSGIYLSYSGNNELTGNTCSRNENAGILTMGSDSHDNLLRNNSCDLNLNSGIHINSAHNTLIRNSCTGNALFGIYLVSTTDSAGYNTLRENRMVENGVMIDGEDMQDWLSLTMENNTVNNKPLYFLTGLTGGDLPSDGGQLILVDCSSLTIEDQNLSQGSVGILIGFSSYINITRTTCSFNTFAGMAVLQSSHCKVGACTLSSNTMLGLLLYESGFSSVENSTVSFNWAAGIYFREADSNTITNNTIMGNTVGIYMAAYSFQNTVSFNLIFNNTDHGINATDNGGNAIDAVNNYWGAPSGPYHQFLNPSGTGDNVSYDVLFSPWKETPSNIFAYIDSISPDPAVNTEMIHFTGHGTGREIIARYRWRSDIDGVLYNGTQAEFLTTGLSTGIHTISLKLQDDAGFWSSEASTTLTVHTRPRAFIDDISPNPALETDRIHLLGRGIDDGTIEGYLWSVDGTETYDTKDPDYFMSLSAGTRTITLRVRDDHGSWSEEVTATLTVHENDRPVAHIDSVTPSPAREDDDVRLLGSGTDDGEITGWCWRSDIDGILAIRETTRDRSLYLANDSRLSGVAGGANREMTIRGAYSQFGADTRTNRRWAEAGTWEFRGQGAVVFRGNITFSIRYWEIDEGYDNEPKFRFTLFRNEENLGRVTGETDEGSSDFLRSYTASFSLGETRLEHHDTLKLGIDYLGWEDCKLYIGGSYQESGVMFEEWQWTMNDDTGENATVSGLTPGTHTIYFSVQDNYGVWSDEVETTLLVKEEAPLEWYEKPAVQASCSLILVVVLVIALIVVGKVPLKKEELLKRLRRNKEENGKK